MEAYYQQQPVSSYISGQYRQRGNGFGRLTTGIGMAALRIARKFLWSVAKKIGLEIIVQASPELVEVVTKMKSPKQTTKLAAQKTLRKQLGGSKTAKMPKQKTNSENQGFRKKKPLPRSRSNFFSKVQRRSRSSPHQT